MAIELWRRREDNGRPELDGAETRVLRRIGALFEIERGKSPPIYAPEPQLVGRRPKHVLRSNGMNSPMIEKPSPAELRQHAVKGGGQSAELGAELRRLEQAEQERQERLRTEELARLRALQAFD